MIKMLSLLSVLIGIGVSAHAGNEGPQATPEDQKVLAEFIASGGFFADPKRPVAYAYQILNNGIERVISHYVNGQPNKIEVVGKLNEQKLVILMKLVETVKPGQLYDPNPDMPMCMDAPSFYYRIYSSHGEIGIAQWEGCKTMARHNSGLADQTIKYMLDDLAKRAKKEHK